MLHFSHLPVARFWRSMSPEADSAGTGGTSWWSSLRWRCHPRWCSQLEGGPRTSVRASPPPSVPGSVWWSKPRILSYPVRSRAVRSPLPPAWHLGAESAYRCPVRSSPRSPAPGDAAQQPGAAAAGRDMLCRLLRLRSSFHYFSTWLNLNTTKTYKAPKRTPNAKSIWYFFFLNETQKDKHQFSSAA